MSRVRGRRSGSFDRARLVTMQVFRIGPERSMSCRHNEMLGAPVTAILPLGTLRQGRLVTIPVGGDWPCGLYFVRLRTQRDGSPSRPSSSAAPLGETLVAVVLPTRRGRHTTFGMTTEMGSRNAGTPAGDSD